MARLNLPNMRHPRSRRTHVYLRALEGLVSLEPDHARRLKYRDFIDAYARLTPAEKLDFEQRQLARSRWRQQMTGLFEDYRRRGLAEGLQKGREEGRALALAQAVLQVLDARRLTATEAQRQQVETCRDLPTLEAWLRRASVAGSADEVLHSAH